MSSNNPKVHAFANRYVADLIKSAPPKELDFGGEEFSPRDLVALYQVLGGVRERLLTEAALLEALRVLRKRNLQMAKKGRLQELSATRSLN